MIVKLREPWFAALDQLCGKLCSGQTLLAPAAQSLETQRRSRSQGRSSSYTMQVLLLCTLHICIFRTQDCIILYRQLIGLYFVLFSHDYHAYVHM